MQKRSSVQRFSEKSPCRQPPDTVQTAYLTNRGPDDIIILEVLCFRMKRLGGNDDEQIDAPSVFLRPGGGPDGGAVPARLGLWEFQVPQRLLEASQRLGGGGRRPGPGDFGGPKDLRSSHPPGTGPGRVREPGAKGHDGLLGLRGQGRYRGGYYLGGAGAHLRQMADRVRPDPLLCRQI